MRHVLIIGLIGGLIGLAGCDPGRAPRDPLLRNQLARASHQAGNVSDDRAKPEQLKFGTSAGATAGGATSRDAEKPRPKPAR